MLYWLFLWFKGRISPEWLGEEAFRSRVGLDRNPYPPGSPEAKQWQNGHQNERAHAFYAASLGPAFNPTDWRPWVLNVFVVSIFFAAIAAKNLWGR